MRGAETGEPNPPGVGDVLTRVVCVVTGRRDLRARKAGGQCFLEADGNDSRLLDETVPEPDAAAVERHRNDGQTQRSVETGEAGLQRRPLSWRDPCAFRPDHV